MANTECQFYSSFCHFCITSPDDQGIEIFRRKYEAKFAHSDMIIPSISFEMKSGAVTVRVEIYNGNILSLSYDLYQDINSLLEQRPIVYETRPFSTIIRTVDSNGRFTYAMGISEGALYELFTQIGKEKNFLTDVSVVDCRGSFKVKAKVLSGAKDMKDCEISHIIQDEICSRLGIEMVQLGKRGRTPSTAYSKRQKVKK